MVLVLLVQYSYILNEYAYYKWGKYLKDSSQHYINDKSSQELLVMSPHKQWRYKRKVEIKTGGTQFKHIHEKLESEGSLEDFAVRLKRNKID